MTSSRKNPWVPDIFAGALVALLASLILFISEDTLLAKNTTEDSPAIYNDALEALSENQEPEVGTDINNEATVSNKDKKFLGAIHDYEEALKTFTIEEYPLYYAMTQNNLGGAFLHV